MFRLNNWLLAWLMTTVLLLPTLSAADSFKFNPFTGRPDNVGSGSSAGGGSGNVGIGTAGWNAYYAADGSTVVATPDLKFSGTDSQFTGNVGVGTSLTTTSALTVMNGNVGIGTWKPKGLFDVGGTVFMNGNVGINTTVVPNVRLEIQSATAGSDLIRIRSTSSTGQATYSAVNNSGVAGSGSYGVTGSAYSTYGALQASNVFLYATIPMVFMSDTATGYIDFAVGSGSGPSTNMRINASGNVGINTLNPQSKLSVGGNTSIGAAYSTIAAPANGMIVQGNLGVGNSSATNLFSVGSNLLNIPSGGNVSIGSATANHKVEVVSTVAGSDSIAFRNTDSGSTSRASYIVGNNTDGNLCTYEVYSSGYTSFGTDDVAEGGRTLCAGAGGYSFRVNNAAGSVRFYTGATERFRAASNGNIGIGSWGSNAPGNNLAIKGTVGIGTGFSSGYIQTASPNGGLIVEGNVGIGSITPGQKLDIQGNARIIGSSATLQVGTNIAAFTPADTLTLTAYDGTAAMGSLRFTKSSDSGTGASLGAASNSFSGTVTDSFGFRSDNGEYFGTSSTPALTILSNNVGIGTGMTGAVGKLIVIGNVGVGSIVPGQKLDVQGTVRSSAISGQVAGTILCAKADGSVGYCSGVVAGVACTCN